MSDRSVTQSNRIAKKCLRAEVLTRLWRKLSKGSPAVACGHFHFRLCKCSKGVTVMTQKKGGR